MTDHRGSVVWFTGLSGAGKTTLARAAAARLSRLGWTVEVVDGDELRRQLSAGLGFSRADREENARRAACLARALASRVDFVLVALIAPYRALRAEIAVGLPNYREIYVNAPLATCEERDPKGLYRRARAGKLPNFTGIDDPYEPPTCPYIETRTDHHDLDTSAQILLERLVISAAGAQDPVALLRAALDSDPGLTMEKYSRRLGVSSRLLAMRLRGRGKCNFRTVREEHLNVRARQLLRRGIPVKEVAFELKFGSPEAFGRFFRRANGLSPSAWAEADLATQE